MLDKLKQFFKQQIYDGYMEKQWKSANPYVGTPEEFEKIFDAKSPVIGILYDFAQEHQYYQNACIDLKVNYKVIDIRQSNWIDKIKKSGCDVFLVWPTIYKPIQKQFWDERLQILVKALNKQVFPTIDMLWLYESKRKTRDWLLVHNLPHPKTEVFFTKIEALEFIRTTKYPIVCKTDQGASSSGVFILKSLRQAKGIISKAFNKGILLKNRGVNDRHRGYIIFQEFIDSAEEWRMIRVGESFFCRVKGKKGEFHSGSGDIVWGRAPIELLDKTKEISEKFKVPNINVDYFKNKNGEYLINEIHALWGGKVVHDPELEGRYFWDNKNEKWVFENGNFFQNRTANLRLEWIKKNWLSRS